MARFVNFTGIVAAAIVLLAVSATAQDGVQPQVSCPQAQSIQFLPANISGTWYEVARNPAPLNVFCVEVNVGIAPNDTNVLQINTTYANSGSFLYVNETVMGSISLGVTLPNTDGYNISFLVGMNKSEPLTTYKLLSTDYDNYALICGYTNATDNATEFGIVLTRNRNITNINETQLNLYEQIGFNISSSFLNGSMATVTQSDQCWANSGTTTTLSFLSAMFAMIYMMLQYFN